MRDDRRRLRHEDDVNPLERLQLLSGDDAAIEAFLDDIDVTSPRAREMLTELARTTTIRGRSASSPTTSARWQHWRAFVATVIAARVPRPASARLLPSSAGGSSS